MLKEIFDLQKVIEVKKGLFFEKAVRDNIKIKGAITAAKLKRHKVLFCVFNDGAKEETYITKNGERISDIFVVSFIDGSIQIKNN